jgi:hypothetical protein
MLAVHPHLPAITPIRRLPMAFARVVTFDDVPSERVAQMKEEMNQAEPPDGLPASEVIVLHDPEAERSLVVVFFETEDDYATGDRILDAMPAGDTPGRRTSVTKYEVAVRRSV